MEVTYIGLLEYFQRCIPKARSRKYIFILSLIARYSDAEQLYNKLEHDWAALNDLTDDKILFLFSTPKIGKRASFFRKKGQPVYVGEMCPFVQMLNGKGIEDNYGEFENLYYNYKQIDWKERHAQTISEFARAYNISEKDIPCLFVYDLTRDRYMAMPVRDNADIYAIIKGGIDLLSEYKRQKEDIVNGLKEYTNIDKYYALYKKLENQADNDDSSQSIAIRAVLQDSSLYKGVKKDICDLSIRKDLKKIGQWKRQYFNDFNNNSENKRRYLKLKKEEKNIEKLSDEVWSRMMAEVKKDSVVRKLKYKNEILHDLLFACVRLQANDNYYNAKENNRNDYIRDMLCYEKYDVLDQTRRGRALAGKAAGEVDLLIQKEGLTITIIEALNLNSLKKSYLDKHIDKVYWYDTAGNSFNIILVYANAVDFDGFCTRYSQHIEERKYIYPLILFDKKIDMEDFKYTDIRVMQSIHNRNNEDTILYHIIVNMRKPY